MTSKLQDFTAGKSTYSKLSDSPASESSSSSGTCVSILGVSSRLRFLRRDVLGLFALGFLWRNFCSLAFVLKSSWMAFRYAFFSAGDMAFHTGNFFLNSLCNWLSYPTHFIVQTPITWRSMVTTCQECGNVTGSHLFPLKIRDLDFLWRDHVSAFCPSMLQCLVLLLAGGLAAQFLPKENTGENR